MTVHLEWPSDVVNRLAEEARQKGLSLDDYVLQTVLKQGASVEDLAIVETEKRRQREEAAANIRELRKGVTLGPDLTIRGLIDKGRRF